MAILPGLPGGASVNGQRPSPERPAPPSSPPLMILEGEPLKENERGIVLSSPIELDMVANVSFQTAPDVQPIVRQLLGPNAMELRQGLLLWDRMHMPEMGYGLSNLPLELQLLKTEGILRTVSISSQSEILGSLGLYGPIRTDIASMALRLEIFRRLEEREPGRWALSRGPKSDLLPSSELAGRGLLVEMHNMIPVPEGQTPLEDILQFRLRRNAELSKLRYHLVMMYNDLSRADLDELVRGEIMKQFKSSIEDYKKVLQESALKSIWTGLTANMGFNFASGTTAAVAAFQKFGTVSSALLGGTSGITLSLAHSLKKAKTSNPFEYVGRYHNELTWHAK